MVATLLGNLFKTLLKKSKLFDPIGKEKTSRSIDIKKHALFETNEKDGEDYLKWAKKHLFLINNLYSLYIYLKEKKKDLKLYSASGDNGGTTDGTGVGVDSLKMLLQLYDTVEKRLFSELDFFYEIILGCLTFTEKEMKIFFENYENSSKIEKLKLLKSKFSLFNSGMDAFLNCQGEWRISSSQLREKLTEELLEKIYIIYENFYNDYSNINFSKKHMSDYLRFPPKDVRRSIQNFFGKN